MIMSYAQFVDELTKLQHFKDTDPSGLDCRRLAAVLSKVLHDDPVLAQLVDRYPPSPDWLSLIFSSLSQSVHFPVFTLKRQIAAENLTALAADQVPKDPEDALNKAMNALYRLADSHFQIQRFESDPFSESEIALITSRLRQIANDRDLPALQSFFDSHQCSIPSFQLDYQGLLFDYITPSVEGDLEEAPTTAQPSPDQDFYSSAVSLFQEYSQKLKNYQDLCSYIWFLIQHQLDRDVTTDSTIDPSFVVAAIVQMEYWINNISPSAKDYQALMIAELQIYRVIYQNETHAFFEADDPLAPRQNQGCLKGLYEKILDLFAIGYEHSQSLAPSATPLTPSLSQQWDDYSNALFAPFYKEGWLPTEHFSNMLRCVLIEDFGFSFADSFSQKRKIYPRDSLPFQQGLSCIESLILTLSFPCNPSLLSEEVRQIQGFIDSAAKRIEAISSVSRRSHEYHLLSEFFNPESGQPYPQQEAIRLWLLTTVKTQWAPGVWSPSAQSVLRARSPALYGTLFELSEPILEQTRTIEPASPDSPPFSTPAFQKQILEALSMRFFQPIGAAHKLFPLLTRQLPTEALTHILDGLDECVVTQDLSPDALLLHQNQIQSSLCKRQADILHSQRQSQFQSPCSYLYLFDKHTAVVASLSIVEAISQLPHPVQYPIFLELLQNQIPLEWWPACLDFLWQSSQSKDKEAAIAALYCLLQGAIATKDHSILDTLLKTSDPLVSDLAKAPVFIRNAHIPAFPSLVSFALYNHNPLAAQKLIARHPGFIYTPCLNQKNLPESPLFAALLSKNIEAFTFYLRNKAPLNDYCSKKAIHILNAINSNKYVTYPERHIYFSLLLKESPMFSCHELVSFKLHGSRKAERIPAYLFLAIYAQQLSLDVRRFSYSMEQSHMLSLQSVTDFAQTLLTHPSLQQQPIDREDPLLQQESTNLFAQLSFSLESPKLIELAQAVGLDFWSQSSALIGPFLRSIVIHKSQAMKRYLYEAFQHEESTPRAHQALALAVDSFVQVGSSSDWLRQFFDFVWDLPLPQATFNGLISSERIFKILEDFSIAFPARQRSRSGFQPKQELSRRFSILKAAITIDWSADPHHPCLRTTILALWKEKYFALAQALLQHCSPPKNIASSTDSSDALTPYGEDVQALCLQRPLLLSNLSVGSSSIAPSSAQGHQNLVANSLQSAYGHFLIDLVQQALRENLFSRPGRTRGRALLFDEAHLDSLISFLKTQLIESCLGSEDDCESLRSRMTLPCLIAHIEEQERNIADQQQAAQPDLKRALSGSESSDGGSPSARIKRVRS